ncbi:MAG: dTMP kinase [Alphaproteobacteria bacterium]
MAGGRFITIEGGEGVGKSTHTRLLRARLEAHGIDAVATREPGGAPGAEDLRKLLVDGEVGRWDAMCEALLHFAARREHLTKTIRPALARGRWVVSDRFADSTMAYQGYGQGLGRETVARLQELAIGDFAPDLTVLLDLPVAEGLARAAGRAGGEDRYERMDPGFHERLRAGFLEIAAAEPERCVIIDAGAEKEAVGAEIWAAVRARLGV